MADDLNIALRVQAKLDEARRAVQGLTGDVQSLGDAGKAAASDVSMPAPAEAAEAAAAIKQVSAAQDEQAAAAERAAQVEQRRQELLARTAPTAEQEAKLAETKKRLAAEAEKAGQMTEKEAQALQKLLGHLDPATSNTQQFAQAQELLNKALAQGSITQDQHTKFMAQAQQRWVSAGNSAKQTAQAMRMLPMQITDITTSLASGMPVWMVAIQQGGQIRDSFGGIGPALKGVASLINPLRLAFGGLAVGITAAVVAYQKGSQEARAFDDALTLSGNAVGMTSSQLQTMARNLDATAGTQAKAAATLLQLAGSGKIVRENMQQIAEVAMLMEAATGKAVENTVKEFEELGKSPVEASRKLDEQYGYLTAAVYEQIKALTEQGRETDAANLAQQTFADVMAQRAPEIIENAGLIERAWRGIKDAVAEAGDALLSIGREASLEDQISKLEEELSRTAQTQQRTHFSGRTYGSSTGRRDELLQELARLRQTQSTLDGLAQSEAEYRQLQRDMMSASDASAKYIDKETKKQNELNAAKTKYADLLQRVTTEYGAESEEAKRVQAQRETEIKGIEDKYKERSTSGRRDNSQTAQVRADLRTLQDAIKQSDALLVRAVEDGTMAIDAAYEQRMADLQESTAAQRQALLDELASPKTTKARRIDIEAQLTLLESSAAKTAADIDKWRTDQQRKLQDLQVRLRVDVSQLTGEFDADAIRQQLEAQYADMRIAANRADDPRQVALAQANIDMLIDAAAQQAAFNAKLEETQRLQGQLAVLEAAINQQAQSGQISQIEAQARINQARAAQVPLLQQIAAELERIRDAMPDGAVAAIDRMTTSIGQLQNEAAAATPVVVNLGMRMRNTVIDGLADAAATAVTEFSNLRDAAATTLKQIAADIVRSNIKQLLTDAFTPSSGSSGGSIFSAAISGVRSIFGFADGGLIRGPGTGTSDSISALVDGRMPIAVSNEEYIQPQRAVKHYGLGFMEAVRTLRLPKPQYAFGGLVSASQRARFATGGLVSAGAAGGAAQAGMSVEVRFTNQGTPKQQVGDARVTQDSGRMVIDVLIADAASNGRGIRAIKAAVNRND